MTASKLGGSGNDWVESITSDSLGNYYVMGQFQNDISFDRAEQEKLAIQGPLFKQISNKIKLYDFLSSIGLN